MKKKIAMFTNNFFPYIGGVPISISRLSKGLRKIGYKVYIFAPNYNNLQEEESKYIIRINNFFQYKKEGMKIQVTNIFSKKLKKVFRKNNFDLVHIHHPFWLGKKGMELANSYNLPVVFSYHTRLEKYTHYLPSLPLLKKYFEKNLAHNLVKSFCDDCDAIISPSETSKNYLKKIGVNSKICVIPTGVDLSYFNLRKLEIDDLRDRFNLQNKKILLSVSRLAKEKNLIFLLKGIKYIKENSKINFKFLLIGDGEEKSKIIKFINENKLNDVIKLIGKVENKEIAKYYLLSDIFVFSSKSETQGMVLLEAMAGKNPVVAIDSSGVNDVIENNYNGYKTEERIESWGNKVIKLMQNENICNKLAENSLDFAKEKSIKNMAKKVDYVYSSLINEKKKKYSENKIQKIWWAH